MSRLVSPTQRKALELLAKGGEVHVVDHVNFRLGRSAFIAEFPGYGHVRLSMATFEALHVQGWLETKPGRGLTYVLSDKGRTQLEVERASESQPRR
jgi:hypothetical protein